MVITLYRSPFTPEATTTIVVKVLKIKISRFDRIYMRVEITRGMRECALSRLKNQNTTQTNQKRTKI